MQVCIVMLCNDECFANGVTLWISISFSEHECGTVGCGHALVVDGNMKNHQDVCFAKNAGYVEFKGLPGRVRSGCPNTPTHKLRYCSHHKPSLQFPPHANTRTIFPHQMRSDSTLFSKRLIVGEDYNYMYQLVRPPTVVAIHTSPIT